MPSSPFRALILLASAAILTVCAGIAGAVETWVGSDGQIRIVPGTEDPAPPVQLAPDKPQSRASQSPAEPVKQKPLKAPLHKPQHAATKPPKAKTGPLDRRKTGAVTPPDPNDPNADKQRMQPLPPMPKPYVPPTVRPATPSTRDPGNPVFSVDPSPDMVPKTNEEDDGTADPGAAPIVVNPAAPGALPTNPVDPTTVNGNAPPNDQIGPNGTQGPANATNGTQVGVPPPAVVIDPTTGRPVVNPPPLGGPTRLRPAVPPVVAPVQPVQPQPATGITSSIPQLPQPATTPNPRSGLDDPLADPQATAYDQVGIRANSFIWRPAIELSAGATSNIQGATNGTASSALRIAPELVGQSDWSRHQLGVEIHGSFTEFPADWALYRPTVTAAVTGRIDFSEDTQLALKAGFGLDKLPSTSALSAAGTTGAGLQQTVTGSAGLTRDIGLFALTLRGEVDRTSYQLSQAQAATASAASLNNTDFVAALRGTYNLTAGVKPFVEVQTDARNYDAPSLEATTLVSHDTTGAAIKGGLALDLGPLLTGEASSGYGFETPNSRVLQTLRAFTVDENLIWSPTRQTKITLSTVTAIEPSLTAGASGAVSRTVGVKLAEDIFRNLTLDLGGSHLDRHYIGVFRTENLAEVTSGLTWKINPNLQTFVRGTFDAFSSSAHTDDYNATTIYAGVRLQE